MAPALKIRIGELKRLHACLKVEFEPGVLSGDYLAEDDSGVLEQTVPHGIRHRGGLVPLHSPFLRSVREQNLLK
jgi:hypothetical protein